MGAEPPEIAPITFPIRPEFLLPERGQLMLPSRESPTVPEVTVYEDRHFLFGEYDIR
jgi:hypothetical protein